MVTATPRMAGGRLPAHRTFFTEVSNVGSGDSAAAGLNVDFILPIIGLFLPADKSFSFAYA